ncbi:MAG: isochorismatase family cysteine hydrolase [Candidatus Omnitrophota bacterium]
MMKVLIVVDMLKDFMEKQGALYCGDESRKIIPFIKEKIKERRASGGKVIYICDTHDAGDKEFSMYDPHAVKGSEGAQIIDELKPGQFDIVLEKKTLRPFYQTDLDGILRELDPEEVGVVGVCTSICVMEAVGGLRVRGYKTVVYSSGVADFDMTSHESALKRMEKTFKARIE